MALTMASLSEKVTALQPSFLTTWFVSGAFTVVVPLLTFTVSRLTNYEGDDNDNNQDDDAYVNCSWWQWSCRRNNNNNNGEEQQDDNEENTAPWWWFWGGDQQDQRQEDETNRALVFCYVWSLAVFGGILFMGFYTHNRGADWNAVLSALAVYANMTFVSLFFLGGLEGGVQVDGPELDESGFYGQFPVLLFSTSLLWTIFALAFFVAIRRRVRQGAITKIDIEPSDYQIHPEPEPSVDDNRIAHERPAGAIA